MPKKVLIPLAHGFEEIEAIAVVDVLRRGGVEVVLAGVNSSALKGAHGVVVQSDCLLESVNGIHFDMIVLPGGGEGTKTLCENERVQLLLKEFDDSGKSIGAICAAPLALDRAGVLKECYTCYPGVSQRIKSSNFIEQSVVESGNIITSRGPGTAICFGLYILKKLCGSQIHDSVKAAILAHDC